MNMNLFNEIQNEHSLLKHGKGYLGPALTKEEEDYFLIKCVIVGFSSKEIVANVRKSILRIYINNEKQKPIEVYSVKIDPNYVEVSEISSKLKNGILEIKIPKSKLSKNFQIPIS